jgi:hypothetical protein
VGRERLEAGELFEQRFDRRIREQQLAMLLPDEFHLHGVVDVRDERVVELLQVQQAEGLLVEAELRPGKDLAEFLDRAVAARQGHECVRQIRHEGFALVHGGHYAQIRDSPMGEFAVDEGLWDDAGDSSAAAECRIRDDAHEPNIAAAVNELQPAPGEKFTHCFCRSRERRVSSHTGAAKDADAFDVHESSLFPDFEVEFELFAFEPCAPINEENAADCRETEGDEQCALQ